MKARIYKGMLIEFREDDRAPDNSCCGPLERYVDFPNWNDPAAVAAADWGALAAATDAIALEAYRERARRAIHDVLDREALLAIREEALRVNLRAQDALNAIAKAETPEAVDAACQAWDKTR
jgi:hypothetical protein